MFLCDHHHHRAYCLSLLKLQCQNNWLKYIIVVNLVVCLVCYQVLAGLCLLHCSERDSVRFRIVQQIESGSELCSRHTSKDLITYLATPPD